jgi:HlyD family secretion protein
MKTQGLLLPIAATGALVYAVVSIAHSQPQRELTTPPGAPPRTDFRATIAAVGLVEPSSEIINLGSARTGVVDQVFVKVGDEVQKDRPLLRLRTHELEAEQSVSAAAVRESTAQVAVADAQVRVAEAELAQSRRLLAFAQAITDSRAISDEERSQRTLTAATQEARLESARASTAAARANVVSAQAKLEVVNVELDRCTIKAPCDATVLQVRVRAGEYVSSAASAVAWLTLGQVHPLHVRADVDEHEAWRVRSGAQAEAQVRGNPQQKVALHFVRFEPLVIPKKNLTGDATERVDTRVLQVVYRVEASPSAPLFVGQQMDVFINAAADVAANRQ